ncbi:MAG: J domain-containing protein, partial [Syntrophobacteraceae bacterium]|nr:J domain-containing protein [Syntrophobacteraceae bacterium]
AEIDPHPVYRLEGRDLHMTLHVSPWEAVLGAEVQVPTPSGPVTLKVPPGSQTGQKMRLRGKGMPNPKGGAGNLIAVINIMVPKELSAGERELFEKLQQSSSFNPRV